MPNRDEVVLKVDMGAEGTRTVKASFPSNSHKAKVEPIKVEEKKVEKVISGVVIQKKKSLGKRFVETFLSDDIKNIKSYIFNDVLIPAAKDTISDIAKGITDTIQGSIEASLFGEVRRSRGSSKSRRDNKPYVSYNKYSSDDRKEDKRDVSSKNRARHNFDDIILASRGDAEEVRDRLVDLIIDYGQASVSDLYDLVGITGNFTDDKYGWDDLSSSSISRVRDGYILNLPKTMVLD